MPVVPLQQTQHRLYTRGQHYSTLYNHTALQCSAVHTVICEYTEASLGVSSCALMMLPDTEHGGFDGPMVLFSWLE